MMYNKKGNLSHWLKKEKDYFYEIASVHLSVKVLWVKCKKKMLGVPDIHSGFQSFS